MTSRELIVTGASGFIGSTLLARGCAGWQTRGIVRSAAGPQPDGRLRVIPAWTEEALFGALEGATAVVHSASVVHRPDTPESEYAHFNMDGTRALLAACRRRRVRRLVFLSTIKVYGEAPRSIVDEGTPVAPETAYARTKLEAERLVLQAAREGGPSGVVLRLSPVFGVGDKGNVHTMIRAISRGRFAVPGDGSTRKSLVHISTVCDAILAALEAGDASTFVVADDETPSVGELADAIAAALGHGPPRRMPVFLMYAAAMAFELTARLRGARTSISRDLVRKSLIPSECSAALIERQLGIKCHVDLRTAIDEEVAWVRVGNGAPLNRG